MGDDAYSRTALERTRERWMADHQDVSYMNLKEECGADGPRFSVHIIAGGSMEHVHDCPKLVAAISECYRRAVFSREHMSQREKDGA